MCVVRLCKSRGVKKHTIVQSPSNCTKILIMGENIDSIREELEAEQRKQYSNFTIKFVNKVGPLYTKHCVGSLSVEQKLASAETFWSWQPDEKATCELLVKASEKNKDHPNEQGAVFAVVPAHLMMSEQLATLAAESDSHQIRCEIEKETTRRRYVCCSQDLILLDLKHPPLIAYRQWQTNNGRVEQEQQDLKLPIEEGVVRPEPAQHISDQDNSENTCPERKCDTTGTIHLCPHMFMNDIAMLHLDEADVATLRNKLSNPIKNEIFPFQLESHLEYLVRGEKEISVGQYRGRLVPCSGMEAGSYGYHIRFQLTSINKATGKKQ